MNVLYYLKDVFLFRPIPCLITWLGSPNQANAVALLISCFSVGVMLFVVFPMREYGRGLTAKLLGDDTPERQGRLTLNPFAHLELIGSLVMLFAPIGWPKRMEFNISRCRKVKAKTALILTSLAGPAANVVIAYVFLVIAKIFALAADPSSTTFVFIMYSLGTIIRINLFIAVLNLLPVPPYDGSRILFSFLHPRTVMKIMQRQQIISLVFLLLFFFPNSPIVAIIDFFANLILYALDFLSGFLG